jgi:hypothetical protein
MVERMNDDFSHEDRQPQKPEYARNTLGHYINCKYYRQGVSEDSVEVDCKKHGVRGGCDDCSTCPKCGGKLFDDTEKERSGEDYILYLAKACFQCGARYQGGVKCVPYEGTWGKGNAGDVPFGSFYELICNVSGCKKTAWDGHKFEGRDICRKHHGQSLEWKRRPVKKKNQIPLLIKGGDLVENPNYIKTVSNKKNGGNDEKKGSSKAKKDGNGNAVNGRGKKAYSGVKGSQGVLPFSFVDSEEEDKRFP